VVIGKCVFTVSSNFKSKIKSRRRGCVHAERYESSYPPETGTEGNQTIGRAVWRINIPFGGITGSLARAREPVIYELNQFETWRNNEFKMEAFSAISFSILLGFSYS
jgi:hypothetical protein